MLMASLHQRLRHVGRRGMWTAVRAARPIRQREHPALGMAVDPLVPGLGGNPIRLGQLGHRERSARKLADELTPKSMGDVSCHGIAQSSCVTVAEECYPCPQRCLLPMYPERTELTAEELRADS